MSHDVVILGAGVAGLAAAVHLAAAGRRPLVLEAAKTVGGRARSHFHPAFGEALDNGPHVLMGTYRHMLAFLERVGSRHLVWEEGAVAFRFWNRRRGWHALTCPDWPAPWHLMAGLAGLPGLSSREKMVALAVGVGVLGGARHAVAQQSVTQWLHAHHQTGALFERFWQPLCLATLNEPPASASASLFVAVLKRLFFGDRWAARPLLPRVSLSSLIGQPAQRFIQRAGGEVRCGCRVRGLALSGDHLRRIDTSWGEIRHPRAVIVALPPVALARLLPAWSGRTGVTRLHASPIVSVHLTYATTAHLPHRMVGLPQESSQWVFDRGLMALSGASGASGASGEGDRGGRFSAVLSGAYRERTWSRERLIATVHRDLQRVVPELTDLVPCAAQVVKEHRATLAAWPGVCAHRPTTQTPWRNVWMAGDWTRTGLPATLEGAAQSGVEAAQQLLDGGAP